MIILTQPGPAETGGRADATMCVFLLSILGDVLWKRRRAATAVV